MANQNLRKPAAFLLISAAGLALTMGSESFVSEAMIPVPGDRPTYGYGSTFKADGSPVKMGDTITKEAARGLLEMTVNDTYQATIKRCAGDVPMRQNEFDAVLDLAYNIGAYKVCGFSIFPKFRAGRYSDGCAAILTVDLLNGKHCRIPENRKNVPGCNGIMNRRDRQFNMCMGN